ncbi:MAG: sigma-70 family RNA polymerase sigma factor [Planctomycetes bacterium]|nr:sigma-70 family RNA polymerase sigma factor [Planctomycetota bacterium]
MPPIDDPSTPDDAFTARYEAIAPALFAWATRHASQTLRARLEIEDLLQEVWLRAYRQHKGFIGDAAAFRSWIFAIAKLVMLEIQRRMHRLQRLGMGAGATSRWMSVEALPASITRITQRLSRDESVRALLDHVAGMSREDQELVSYCGLEGATCAEAARRLGIREDAAIKRWQRLRARLRDSGFAHAWLG